MLFSKNTAAAPFSPLWLAFWALILSLGWQLPNHYLPWPNFHSDLWIAVVLGAAAVVVVGKSKRVAWPWLALLGAIVAMVPLVQYEFGLLPFAGQAAIATLYLVGFTLAVVIGSQWERLAPGQAAGGLLLAIGVAAIVSVGLQLYQWLIEGHGNTAFLLPSPGSRPYANFAQPNQLATFLLWGLIACAWAAHARKIRPAIAIFMAAYLLFGIALTQSRTALVAILTATLASWLWRRLWAARSTPWLVAGLALYFLACLGSMDGINSALLLDIGRDDLLEKTRHEVRSLAYSIFTGAVLHSPWWGYGWSETARAQLAVVEGYRGLGGHFYHAHNLFLDLMLWCGVPIGGSIIALILTWFIPRIRKTAHPQEALLVMFVGAVGWHSMTELPLHYASFLLPTGLVMGILGARTATAAMETGRSVLVATLGACTVALALVTHDYFEVEANFFALRFERAGLSNKPPLPPPEVIVLTQLREYIRSMRTEPKGGLSEREIQTARDLANSFPSEATLFNLIRILTLNNRLDEARLWILKLSKVTTQERYAYLGRVWMFEGKKAPQLLVLNWPQWPNRD